MKLPNYAVVRRSVSAVVPGHRGWRKDDLPLRGEPLDQGVAAARVDGCRGDGPQLRLAREAPGTRARTIELQTPDRTPRRQAVVRLEQRFEPASEGEGPCSGHR